MSLFGRLRILPLLIAVAMLAFAIRTGDFITALHDSGAAYAQGAPAPSNAQPPPLPAMPVPNAPAKNTPPPPVASGTSTQATPALPAIPSMQGGTPVKNAATSAHSDDPSKKWEDATDADSDYSDVKMGLYKDLVARRKELDKRAQALDTREALLEAAQREMDQKLRELNALRDQIQGLLKKQSDQQQARITSLVKIYEGMKAKDAARIFNTLDMDVLIQVMSRMSDRKSAPILAAMNPDRARAVTILLAQQNQLPSLPSSQ